MQHLLMQCCSLATTTNCNILISELLFATPSEVLFIILALAIFLLPSPSFMNLQHLKDLYATHPVLFRKGAESVFAQQKISLRNAYGSSMAFVFSTVFEHTNLNHIVVLNNKDEAAYFHNDIEHITDALDICFFPDSYKKIGAFQELNSSHLMLRGEALMKWNTTKELHKKVLVTYPEALFEKVVNETSFSKNSLLIKVSDTIDLDFVAEFLVPLGFTKEDFAFEPGQFAIRGGILDIYSFGNDKPYRIELFGNEVDTIRIFDPETQLSERKLVSVQIIPNVETSFETQDKVSLLNYVPDNTVFWFSDIEFCKERIIKLQQTLSDSIQVSTVSIDDANNVVKELQREDFENIADWLRKLELKNIVEFGGNSIEHVLREKPAEAVLNTIEQPAFNRNFDMLLADLKQKQLEGYEIFICAENAKQLERLRHIFEEMQSDVVFTPLNIGISKGFVDHSVKVAVYTDHQIFQRYHKYRIKQAFSKGKAITMRSLKELVPGDFVVHIDHGVGRYSGLQKIEVNGAMQEAIRIVYKDNDMLYVNINSLHKITKYSGKEGTEPSLHKIGSGVWEKTKAKTKKKVKDIAINLIRLYAERKTQEGFAHNPDTYLETELEANFMYEDTPDQSKATADIKRDMESMSPMDRLVCGDVGFGKTELAIRAAFKSVVNGKQAAVLVPTTILAYQHYQTFKQRLKEMPCTVDYINRFKSTKQKKETLQSVQDGSVDILIGTHALLSKDVRFKDLGLLIIDEEQKFGVAAKEKIRDIKTLVDTLTLTATPIPRTLQFSLMGARDLSIINTPPPNRQPVHTELAVWNEVLLRDAIYYETERGGQVYFVHNRIHDLPEIKEKLQKYCPDVSIEYAHGQLPGDELEEKILDFMSHKFDVLLCTNIVESGVDIANANTIIINNAHQFGMSDLHQLRGRVGRSNTKAFCYLLSPPISLLPNDSRKRLQTLEQFSELGSGFQISMRDLDIRGAGNLLGGEQSGFISDIGFEMYQKILNEAIRELKHNEFKDVFKDQLEHTNDYVTDCTIDTDVELLIPDAYVENIAERLSLYTQLDDCENEEQLQKFLAELIDRFGPLPKSIEKLAVALRCRWIAVELGFEKLIFKNKQLRLYFISNPESPYFEGATFNNIMQVIQGSIRNARLKQVGKNFMMIVDAVPHIEAVYELLERLK
jgi:transcription-repair coupling factor (superfamily II helicase)